MVDNEEDDETRLVPVAEIDHHEFDEGDVQEDDDEADDDQKSVGELASEELLDHRVLADVGAWAIIIYLLLLFWIVKLPPAPICNKF